jgi:hypothetical protein
MDGLSRQPYNCHFPFMNVHDLSISWDPVVSQVLWLMSTYGLSLTYIGGDKLVSRLN